MYRKILLVERRESTASREEDWATRLNTRSGGACVHRHRRCLTDIDGYHATGRGFSVRRRMATMGASRVEYVLLGHERG